jgi:hypothetical protein
MAANLGAIPAPPTPGLDVWALVGESLQLEEIVLTELLRLDDVQHQGLDRAAAVGVDKFPKHPAERRARSRRRLVIVRLPDLPTRHAALFKQRRQVET